MDDKLLAYRESLKNIQEQSDKKIKEVGRANDEKMRIKHEIYRPRINALETEMQEEIDKVSASSSVVVNECDKIIEQHLEVKKEIDKLFELMSFHRTQVIEKDTPEIVAYVYSDRDQQGNYLFRNKRKVFIEPIEVICNDAYKCMKVFITENRKPKNKYSLVLVFNSIFGDNFKVDQGQGRSFVSNFNTTSRHNNAIVIKEAPTFKSLAEWYEKQRKINRTALINNILDEHAVMESRYHEAVALYEKPEWRLAYMYWLKDYYTNGVSGGSLSDEYKAVLEEIRILKTPMKDLPLLISEVKFCGEVLSQRLKGA